MTFQNNVQSDGVDGSILSPMVLKFCTLIILILTQLFPYFFAPEFFHLAVIDGSKRQILRLMSHFSHTDTQAERQIDRLTDEKKFNPYSSYV